MKFVIVFAGVVACALAQYTNDGQAQIVSYTNEQNPDGSYRYAYQTSNGIAAEEVGTPKNIGPETPVVKQGSYQYTSPEGLPISLSYIADEFGVRVAGNALPTSPPIPDYILRSLEFNEREAAAGRRYQ